MTHPIRCFLVDMAAFLIAFGVIGFAFRTWARKHFQRIGTEEGAGLPEFAGRESVLRFRFLRQTFIVSSAYGDLFRRLGFSESRIVNRDIRFFFESVGLGAEACACCESAWLGNEDVSCEGASGGIAFRCSFRPIRHEGAVREVEIAFEDVTLRRQLKEQTRLASLYRTVAEEAAEWPVIGLSKDGTVVYVSPAAAAIWDGEGEALPDQALIDFLHPDDQLVFLRQCALAKEAGEVAGFRCRIRTGGGYAAWNLKLRAGSQPDGGIARFVFVEGRADSAPDGGVPSIGKAGKIAAGVAHEIRNPLTTIKGISQMMRKKYPAEEYLIRVLMQDVGKIETFLDEFVLLFDQDEGEALTEVDILAFVREAVDEIRSSSGEVDCALEGNDLPEATARGHPSMLRTLLRRILANIAETLESRGKIRAVVERREDDWVVSFAGGRDESILGRWNREVRPDLPRSRKEFGFGNLVMEKIVEYHRGKLSIEHSPDGAVRVVLVLPAFNAERSLSRRVQQFKQLTRREKEVLLLLGHGKSNKEMAAQLQISENTVKNHLANIFSKLNVYDRAQAIALLYQVPVE